MHRYTDQHAPAAAREWARRNGFRLVHSAKCCWHVLAKRPCPSTTRYAACAAFQHPECDHALVWQRPDGSRFVLAHLYGDRATVLRDVVPFAMARGLTVCVDDTMSWYGHGTIPVRYDLPDVRAGATSTATAAEATAAL